MAWTTPKTWSVNEFVTAAMLNTHVRDNLLEVTRILARSTTTVDVVSTAAETTLFTTSVPAGVMETDRVLRLSMYGDWRKERDQNDSMAFRFYFGGSMYAYLGVNTQVFTGDVSRGQWKISSLVANTGAANVQRVQAKVRIQRQDMTPYGGLIAGSQGQPGSIVPVLGVNTNNVQTLSVTMVWSASSAVNSFRHYYSVLELV